MARQPSWLAPLIKVSERVGAVERGRLSTSTNPLRPPTLRVLPLEQPTRGVPVRLGGRVDDVD
jgi:hypothetical protein